jgi:NTP pyrophosphatase (non-canonical NTP hydrolase)
MKRVFSMKQVEILNAIIKERQRQDLLHPKNSKGAYLAILVEELGEVAKAIQEGNIDQQKEELIQLSAVVVRWLEEI